jgi:NTE family protein
MTDIKESPDKILMMDIKEPHDTLKNLIKINLSKKTKLVLSSGGLKGISHVGVVRALEEFECMTNIDTIVGVSAGSFVAALITIGFTSIEMRDILLLFDFSKTVSIKIGNIIEKFGMDDGSKYCIFIKKLFESKDYKEDLTFKQLYEKTKKKLIIVVTCVNTRMAEYLSVDTTPDMLIIKAIRMSSSIPIYFAPVIHDNKYYIDGACMDGYPMHLFCDILDQVIGVHLSEIEEEKEEITNVESYSFGIIKTLMKGLSNNTLKGYEKNSVIIKTKRIGFANMNINTEDKQYLFDLGYNTLIQKFGY